MPVMVSNEDAKSLEDLYDFANGGTLIIFRESDFECLMHYMSNVLSQEDRDGFDSLALEHMQLTVVDT